MSMETARERLVDLKAAHLPRLDWRTVFTAGPELTEEHAAALDTYFRHFLPPGPCVACGAQQGGDEIDWALGRARFTWGLAHGEGFCGNCHWPGRAYHRDVGPIKFLNLILQYHPDELKPATP